MTAMGGLGLVTQPGVDEKRVNAAQLTNSEAKHRQAAVSGGCSTTRAVPATLRRPCRYERYESVVVSTIAPTLHRRCASCMWCSFQTFGLMVLSGMAALGTQKGLLNAAWIVKSSNTAGQHKHKYEESKRSQRVGLGPSCDDAAVLWRSTCWLASKTLHMHAARNTGITDTGLLSGLHAANCCHVLCLAPHST